MKLRVLVVSLLVLFGSTTSHATPFDLIVPSLVRIDTASTVGSGWNSWGWLIASGPSIPYSELVGATATGTVTGGVTVDVFNHEIRNEHFFNPGGMAHGDVAGMAARTLYAPLLGPGETLPFPTLNLYDAGFLYPVGYSGTEVFTATVTIGGDSVTYSTTVELGPSLLKEIESAQRLSSSPGAAVPEPSSLLLLGAGLVGLRAWGKRRV